MKIKKILKLVLVLSLGSLFISGCGNNNYRLEDIDDYTVKEDDNNLSEEDLEELKQEAQNIVVETVELDDFSYTTDGREFILTTSWDEIDCDGFEVSFSEKKPIDVDFPVDTIKDMGLDYKYSFTLSEGSRIQCKIRAYKLSSKKIKIYGDWSNTVEGFCDSSLLLPRYEYLGEDEVESICSSYMANYVRNDFSSEILVPVIDIVRVEDNEINMEKKAFGNFWLFALNKVDHKLIVKDCGSYRGVINISSTENGLEAYSSEFEELYSNFESNIREICSDDEELIIDLISTSTEEIEALFIKNVTEYVKHNNLKIDRVRDISGFETFLDVDVHIDSILPMLSEVPKFEKYELTSTDYITSAYMTVSSIENISGYEYHTEITYLESGDIKDKYEMSRDNIYLVTVDKNKSLRVRVRTYSLKDGEYSYSEWSEFQSEDIK